MLIHKDALAVSDVTTKDDTRYFLNGALFDKEGRAVATDGHLLIRFASDPLPPKDFPGLDGVDVSPAADVIVDAGELRAARATMAARSTIKALDYMAVVPNGDHVTLATTDLDREVRIKARKVGGNFPAYESVLTVKNPVVAELSFNPQSLEVLARIAVKVGVKKLTLKVHALVGKTEISDQVLFAGRGTNGTLDGAIMTMRP